MQNNFKRWAALAVAVVASATTFAAPFTPGNLVVSRVGDGAAALTNGATATFLDEYTPAGVFVQTINMPTSVSGSNLRLTNSGTATSELQLNRSTDGRFLTLGGYDAVVGSAGVVATTSATNPRVVALVDWNGNVDTTTALADAYSANNIRAAVTTDGSQFWIAGSGGGTRWCNFGATASTLICTTVTTVRGIGIFNSGQLYISAMSSTFRGVSSIGTPPPPSTAGQVATLLPGFDPGATSPQSVYGFWFKDANTLYVADDRNTPTGGIQRWDLVAGTWTLQYTLSTGLPGLGGCRGLTGKVVAGNAVLYATAAGTVGTVQTALVTVTDTGAGSSFTVLASAPTNTAFRGVAFAPENSGPVSVAPTFLNIAPGTLVSGGIPEVTNSDDSRLHAKVNPASEDTGYPVQMNIEATSPVANPTSFQFTLETFVEIDGISQYIELWDWTANGGAGNWVRISNVFASSSGDTSVTASASGTLSRFVRSGDKRIRAQIGWEATAADVDIPYFAKVDQAVWKIGG